VPFKGEAFAACARLSERARRAEAVNTIVFEADGWFGDNTDGAGLVRDIELNAGVPLRGKRVLVLGAGGAAAGALDPLLAARPAALVVANRTAAKAQAWIERFAASAARLDVPLVGHSLEAPGADFDVLVNATAASLQAAVPPLPAGTLRPGALALDMMYGAAAAALPALGARAGRGRARRPGHAGRAGGRGVLRLDGRASEHVPGAHRAAARGRRAGCRREGRVREPAA
jgi:shikimate dehydrogenase